MTWIKKILKFFIHLLAGPARLTPGGLGHLQVPGEYFFGLKLKIYVKITYFEHLSFYEKNIFITPFLAFI